MSVLPSLYSPVAVSDVTKMICFERALSIIYAETEPSAIEDSRWNGEGKPLGIQSKQLYKYNWELGQHVLGTTKDGLCIDSRWWINVRPWKISISSPALLKP